MFPRWHAFVRQYHDPMQIVLLAAGIGSLYPLRQLGTGILQAVTTPLTRQLDRLTGQILVIAGIASMALNLAGARRGDDLDRRQLPHHRLGRRTRPRAV